MKLNCGVSYLCFVLAWYSWSIHIHALDYRFGKLQANDDSEIAVIRTFVTKWGGSVNVKS